MPDPCTPAADCLSIADFMRQTETCDYPETLPARTVEAQEAAFQTRRARREFRKECRRLAKECRERATMSLLIGCLLALAAWGADAHPFFPISFAWTGVSAWFGLSCSAFAAERKINRVRK